MIKIMFRDLLALALLLAIVLSGIATVAHLNRLCRTQVTTPNVPSALESEEVAVEHVTADLLGSTSAVDLAENVLRLANGQIQRYNSERGWTCVNELIRDVVEDEEVATILFDTRTTTEISMSDFALNDLSIDGDGWSICMSLSEEGLILSGDLHKMSEGAEIFFGHYLKQMCDEYIQQHTDE